MTITALLLMFVAPPSLALLRRRSWSREVITLVAVAFITLLYTVGTLIEGGFVWPPSREWIGGLLAAYGGAQLTYEGWRTIAPETLRRVEDV